MKVRASERGTGHDRPRRTIESTGPGPEPYERLSAGAGPERSRATDIAPRTITQLARRAVSKAFFPLHERVFRRPTFTYLAYLERTQWLSREDLEALQMARVKALMQVAWRHCPWHAARIDRLGIDLGEDSPPLELSDLQRLPTMDAADAREHRDALVWRNVPGGAFRYNTGGSSGHPLIFYFGRSRQASDAAGRLRARRWWGVEIGDPEVYLWGAPVELSKTDRVKTLRDRLLNQLVLNAFDMSPQSMDLYIQSIRAFKPRCLYGYASSLALLAAHARAREADMRMRSLKVVCTTGEPLYPDQRVLIQEVFGAPVANEFGSRDIGFTAHETPQGQMLLMSESILLEVLDVDGNPVRPGEPGEAVMTGLCSEAQPFIRYRTGDMVRISDERCRSGRGLHVIEEVLGRQTDFLVRADGAIMHALAVIYVLRDCEGVARFKVIQHTVDRVEVVVLPDARWTSGAREQIVRGLRDRLGHEVRIEVRLVESIDPEASGKHRYVVSHVAMPSALGAAGSLGVMR